MSQAATTVQVAKAAKAQAITLAELAAAKQETVESEESEIAAAAGRVEAEDLAHQAHDEPLGACRDEHLGACRDEHLGAYVALGEQGLVPRHISTREYHAHNGATS